jgi:ubiquinone/menaquinone biosynthesis C-methylase UbiE
VFCHYLHPDIVLAEVFRLLKAGGKIFILDVTADDCFIANINRRVQRKEKAHVSFYSTPAYKEMFSGSGLRYLRSIRITYPLKLHIAEKAGSQNRI